MDPWTLPPALDWPDAHFQSKGETWVPPGPASGSVHRSLGCRFLGCGAEPRLLLLAQSRVQRSRERGKPGEPQLGGWAPRQGSLGSCHSLGAWVVDLYPGPRGRRGLNKPRPGPIKRDELTRRLVNELGVRPGGAQGRPPGRPR